MRPRVDVLGDSDNAERWMVSYADFITLLFAFFVVMYAISSVNDEKYRVLSETLAFAFENENRTTDPIQVGEPDLAASPHVVDVPGVVGWADPIEGDTHLAEATVSETAMAGFAQQEGVSLRTDNDWVELSLAGDVIFSGGSATLSRSARQLLAEMAGSLLEHDHPITVEGYTDNVPSQGERFPSNWALAAARASAVADALVQLGVDQERLSAIGYGENFPLQTNATPDGRAANRRVVVVVARRQDLARNRNAAKAVAIPLRQDEPIELIPQRTSSGGLLFTNESETPAAELPRTQFELEQVRTTEQGDNP